MKKIVKEIMDSEKKLREQRHDFENKYLRPFLNDYIEFMKTIGKGYELSISRLEWEFDNKFIYCNWEENWQYGGHDSGSYRIPLLYLVDEKSYEKFKIEETAEYNRKQKLEKEKSIEFKKSEIERLKRELKENEYDS